VRKRGWLCSLLIVLPFVLRGAPAYGAEVDLAQPLPVDPNVTMAELPNGLQCWVRPHKTPPNRVGIWLHVKSGSINEEDDQRGLAHFLEHLAFDGSANFPPGTLVKYFESIGLTFGHHQNAFTGFDQTTYLLTLPDAEEDTVRKGLTCMADFAFRLGLLPDEIEKERKVILEEARARKGVAQRLSDKLLPVLLPGSRAAERRPIGTEEVVQKLSQGDFASYYHRWYRPDNCALLIVGDMDPAAVQNMVAEAFADWQPVPDPPPNADPGVKPYAETRAAVITDPELTAGEVDVAAVRPLEKMQTVGDLRRELLDDLGLWIVNRRLNEMVQKGTAPFRRARLSKQQMWNVCMYVDAEAVGEPEQWEAMLESLVTELKRARDHGFLAEEFADAKKALLATAEQDARTELTQDASAFLRYMNDCVSEGRRPMSDTRRLELLKALVETVGAEEAADAFRKDFDPQARLLLATMPEKEGVAVPAEAELLSVAAGAEGGEAAPPEARKRPRSLLEKEPIPGTVAEQEEDEDLGVLSVTLSNGVRAHLRSMDFKKGEVFARITLAGGTVRETAGSRGLTAVAALAFQQPATRALSSTDIRDLMTGKNVSVGGAAGADALTISIKGSPEDVEDGFRLAHVLLTEARIEPSALKVWRQQTLQAIESRKTSVEAQMTERADVLLSGDDRRFRFLTRREVESLSVEGGQQWLSRILRSAPIEVAVVGDIERDRALTLVLKYLGSLRRRQTPHLVFPELRKLDQTPGPRSAALEVETITPRACVLVGWRGADWADVKDRRLLQTAAMVLTSRLREELREKRGLTYSSYCDARPAKAYPGTGLLAAYFEADPERAAQVANLARGIVQRFAQEGPTPEEMATVHKQFANIIETSQKEPSYWVDVLSDLDYHGTRLSDVKEALLRYTSYTGEEVLEALARYVKEERRVEVMAMPAHKSEPAPKPAGGELQATGAAPSSALP